MAISFAMKFQIKLCSKISTGPKKISGLFELKNQHIVTPNGNFAFQATPNNPHLGNALHTLRS